MKDIFFQDKGKRILLSLSKRNNQNISEISIDIKGTFAHTYNLLKEMESGGVVAAKKDGRTKYISLTPNGRKIAELVKSFDAILRGKRIRVKKHASAEKETEQNASGPVKIGNGKLQKYSRAANAILQSIKSAAPSQKNIGKIARISGRYKSLVLRLRPKDSQGKELKTKTLLILEKVIEECKK